MDRDDPWSRAAERALGVDEATALMPHLRRLQKAKGAAVFRWGTPSSSLYLVCEGHLTASRGDFPHRLVLGEVKAGAWLGEVGLIDGGPATATVTADVPCKLLELTHDDLSKLDPMLTSMVLRQVTRELAARLRRSSTGMLERADGKGYDRAPAAAPQAWWTRALGWLSGTSR